MFKPIDDNITEDAFRRIKAMVGDETEDEKEDPVKNINLVFTTQQRMEIYNEVLVALQKNDKPQQIANNVIALLNDHINNRMEAAKKRKQGKSPIFRRVE